MTPHKGKDRITLLARGGAAAVFVVVATALLAGPYSAYASALESLNFFNFSTQWLGECMQRAGGLVAWISTGLTCTLGLPAAGAVIYALVLLLEWWCAAEALRLPGRWRPALAVVPALSLVYLLGLGYAAFSMKAPGFAYSLPVGLLAACGILALYTRVGGASMRCIVAVAAALCYPLIGVFALLGAALCAAWSIGTALRCLRHGTAASGTQAQGLKHIITAHIVPAVLALTSAFAVPGLWYRWMGAHLPQVQIWYTPLPRISEGEESLRIPVIAVFATLMAVSLLAAWLAPRADTPDKADKQKKPTRLPLSLAASLCLWAGALALMVAGVGHDTNLRLTLEMRRLLKQGRWTEALERYSALEEEPTRLNVAMGYVAALHSDTAPSTLFSLPVGSAPYRGVRTERVMHEVGAPDLSLYLGLGRFAYRWAMEDMVEYGRNAGNLQLLARCSLLGGEPRLALKYIDALASIPGHGAEADLLRRIARGRTAMESDPVLAAAASLPDDRDEFSSEAGYYEGYLWPFLASYDHTPATTEKADLTLLSTLITQDQAALAAALPRCIPAGTRLPRHYAEAVLLWDAAKMTHLADEYLIDEGTRQAFDRFLEIYNRHRGQGTEMLSRALRSGFGNTYWYYYTCVKQLDII